MKTVCATLLFMLYLLIFIVGMTLFVIWRGTIGKRNSSDELDSLEELIEDSIALGIEGMVMSFIIGFSRKKEGI